MKKGIENSGISSIHEKKNIEKNFEEIKTNIENEKKL